MEKTFIQRSSVRLSCLVPVYNEAQRIRYVLDHAVQWADEVVVINKQSTDDTKKICESYGEKVRVVDVSFSKQGHEDMQYIVTQAKNDWVFITTASEVPTKKLIETVFTVLQQQGELLELVRVPRRGFSFGIDSEYTPWAVTAYPFLINQKKAIIKNVIHNNFSAHAPEYIYEIPYTPECCVFHFTHTSAAHYLRAMAEYFEAEADNTEDYQETIRGCFKRIWQQQWRIKNGGAQTFMHYCAWPLYWLGTALFVWEKQFYKNRSAVTDFYKEYKDYLIATEWQGHAGKEIPKPQLLVNSERVLPAVFLALPTRFTIKTKLKYILFILFVNTPFSKFIKMGDDF